MAKLRMALVGCGGMARNHANRFEDNADRVELAWAVDALPERARAVADLVPGCRVETDWRKVVGEVDAALIVLPHHLHCPAALDFLNAGRHVLCEKPLANSEEECQAMIAAARRSGRILMTAYCMRYDPLVVRMKEILDARTYGEVFNMSIFTEQYTHYPEGHWGNRAATLGGGQFFSHGCHYVDILLWFLGRPVRGVHFGTRKGTPWMEGEGTSNCVMEFENGVTAYHYGTWGSQRPRSYYYFQADSSNGVVQMRRWEGKLVALTRDAGEEVLLEAPTGKATKEEMSHFLDCIETGRKPLTDAESSLKGLRVIWRMYEAERANTLADLRGMGLEQAIG